MKSTVSARIAAALLSSTMLAGLSSAAMAQTGADEQGASDAPARDVILVTARKREEDLTDVPLAITAITGAEIEASGIDNIADVALQTPGFSLRQGFGRSGGGQGGGNVRPAIRGMSSILGSPNAAFFVDGVFVSGNISSYQLDNLAQVEVVRGPQSALFGRQTFAGAINFITREPTEETQGRISLTTAEHEHYEATGYLSGMLLEDTLFGELSGRWSDFGGDYANADGGPPIGGQETMNLAAKLIWRPSAAWDVTLNVGWSQDRDESFPYAFQGSDQLNCFLPNITGSFFGIPLSSNRSRGYFCGEIETPDSFAYNINELRELGYWTTARNAWRSSLRIDHEFDNGYELTSITAYNTSTNQNGFDNTLLPSDDPNFSIGGSSVSDVSQQLRILSPQERRIRWLAGVYYYLEEDGDGFDASGLFSAAPEKELYRSGDSVENRAVFAMIEADVTDRLTLSAEARYQEDEITATDLVFGAAGSGVRPDPVNERTASYDAFLPRVTARYAINDDMNLYGSIAQGNKPGGFNSIPPASEFFDQQDFNEFTAQFDSFDEETVLSYELGVKGVLFGGAAQYSAAVYYLDWQDQQLTQSQPYLTASSGGASGTTTPFVVNAGESEIKGFELEMFGSLGERIDYRFGYAYSDAEIVDFYDENTEEIFDTDGLPSSDPADVDGPNGQVAGNALPQTPEHMFNASGTFRQPLSDTVEWFVRGDYAYESKRWVQVHNLAHTGASHNLNLRTGLETDNWTFTIFLNNALDDDTPLVVTRLLDFNRTLLIPDPVRNFIFLPNRRFTFYRDFTISAPRQSQIGATFSYRF
ncbi:MAG: TonB-dependent receptor [Pseudomonadota bacterium]